MLVKITHLDFLLFLKISNLEFKPFSRQNSTSQKNNMTLFFKHFLFNFFIKFEKNPKKRKN